MNQFQRRTNRSSKSKLGNSMRPTISGERSSDVVRLLDAPAWHPTCIGVDGLDLPPDESPCPSARPPLYIKCVRTYTGSRRLRPNKPVRRDGIAGWKCNRVSAAELLNASMNGGRKRHRSRGGRPPVTRGGPRWEQSMGLVRCLFLKSHAGSEV